jgi:hypothetical protein
MDEFAAVTLVSKLQDSEIASLRSRLSEIAFLDQRFDTGQQVVDFDAAMMEILSRLYSEQERQKGFVQVLFNAADLNGDGYLQMTEGKLLVRHLSMFPIDQFKPLFSASSDLTAVDGSTNTAVISFDRFAMLSLRN